jgi:hypothetical protein
MAKSGIRKYGGDEGSNVALGQAGCTVLANGSTTVDEDTGDGNFVSFKVIGGNDAAQTATLEATTHIGAPFPSTAVLTGEIVWGPFKKITCTAKSDVLIEILCYNG